MPKIKIITITFFATVSILYTGSTLLSSSDTYSKIGKGLKLFGEIYKQVSTTYVDEIDPETFVEAAIRGMLQTLDPYTTYISSENNGAPVANRHRHIRSSRARHVPSKSLRPLQQHACTRLGDRVERERRIRQRNEPYLLR